MTQGLGGPVQRCTEIQHLEAARSRMRHRRPEGGARCAEDAVIDRGEAGIPGFSVLDWQGLFTTGKTPPAVVNKLNAEVVRILALPDVVEKLAVAGVEIQTSTPKEWGEFVQSEIAKWSKVVKEAGVKVE